MKKYVYFVSFNLDVNGGSGFGNTRVELDSPISDIEDIRAIEKLITDQNKEKYSAVNTVILNFQKLKKMKPHIEG